MDNKKEQLYERGKYESPSDDLSERSRTPAEEKALTRRILLKLDFWCVFSARNCMKQSSCADSSHCAVFFLLWPSYFFARSLTARMLATQKYSSWSRTSISPTFSIRRA